MSRRDTLARMQRTNRAFRTRSLCALALVATTLAMGGCREPLFPKDEPRTQFDRYDLSRNQFEPQFVEDEFGRREPNLRGRLAPKD